MPATVAAITSVPATVAAITPSPVAITVETPPSPIVQALPVNTLRDIFNGRDDLRTVQLVPIKSRLMIAKDKFGFSLKSSHAGYVYLLMVGSDGKTFDLLFPNKLDANNRIKAGETRKFPLPSWELLAQGPEGTDHLLAIVADAPRDLSNFPLANAGPFSEVSVTAEGQRDIQLVSSSTTQAAMAECLEARKRNLVAQPVCSDAYGAALITVEEVK